MTSITTMVMSTELTPTDFCPFDHRDHAKRVDGGQNHHKPNSIQKDKHS
jgi:hypothetical protein